MLSLVTGNSPFAEEFAAATARLSGGAIRIDIRVGRVLQANYERFTVEDVQKGKAQLGSVAARVWDTMGVTSLRALLAPLFVDSLALQRRVLESPLAARMLAGLDRGGVVGLAITPGPLPPPARDDAPARRPRRLRGSDDRDQVRRRRPGDFRGAGATTRGYTSGAAPFDGAELDLKTIVDNGYDAHAQALTSDIVLWPRPQTIFANRAAFARLTPAQQEILRRAGREALAPSSPHGEGAEGGPLCPVQPPSRPLWDHDGLRACGLAPGPAAGLRGTRARCGDEGADRGHQEAPRHGVGRPERVGTLHPSWQNRHGRARGKLAEHRDA